METDRTRVGRVADILDAELQGAERERNGLQRRLDDLLARAAISQGNDTDEYLTRDDALTEHLNLFDAQMRGAEGRLKQLDESIAHFRFLKDELSQRFPGLIPVRGA